MPAVRSARTRRTWWSSVTSARGLSIVAIVIAVGTPASAATVLITAKQLAANSVTSKAIKNGSVSNADLGLASVTAKNLAKGSVTTTALGAGAVTSANIAAGAVTASQLAPGTIPTPTPAFTLNDGMVTGAKLAASSVGASNLATGAVTGTKLLDGTVDSADIAAGAITAGKIGTGAVTSTAILDGTITAADAAPAIGASLDTTTVQAINNDLWNGSSAQNYVDEELDGFYLDFGTSTTPWATTGMINTATNPSRITVTIPGLYQVNAATGWNQNSTGYREISLVVNGTQGAPAPGTGTVAAISRVQASSNTTRTLQTISTTVALTAGDYIGVRVSQDTGSALNLIHGSLSLVRIGSTPT
ncbi:MAG: hypothetical protein H7287_12025 [Thermoleophilia bacterium]|nr:hypothetical protein [Thermoleophilia bacterium]